MSTSAPSRPGRDAVARTQLRRRLNESERSYCAEILNRFLYIEQFIWSNPNDHMHERVIKLTVSNDAVMQNGQARKHNRALQNPTSPIAPLDTYVVDVGHVAPDMALFPSCADEFYALRDPTELRKQSMLIYLARLYNVVLLDKRYVGLDTTDEGILGIAIRIVELLEVHLGLDEKRFIEWRRQSRLQTRLYPSTLIHANSELEIEQDALPQKPTTAAKTQTQTRQSLDTNRHQSENATGPPLSTWRYPPNNTSFPTEDKTSPVFPLAYRCTLSYDFLPSSYKDLPFFHLSPTANRASGYDGSYAAASSKDEARRARLERGHEAIRRQGCTMNN